MRICPCRTHISQRRLHHIVDRGLRSPKERVRDRPIRTQATKCASNCRAGKVAVTLGAPRREVVYCDAAAAAACEDALGYCDPAAVEAARDEDVDRQLEAILERGRRSTRQKKRR